MNSIERRYKLLVALIVNWISIVNWTVVQKCWVRFEWRSIFITITYSSSNLNQLLTWTFPFFPNLTDHVWKRENFYTTYNQVPRPTLMVVDNHCNQKSIIEGTTSRVWPDTVCHKIRPWSASTLADLASLLVSVSRTNPRRHSPSPPIVDHRHHRKSVVWRGGWAGGGKWWVKWWG